LAMGTDCSNTGGRHDLFEIMRHMLVSGRDPGSDFDAWIKPEEVLTAATSVGAGALGNRQPTGLLERGRAADVLVVDFESFGLATSPVTIGSLVSHADPRNVNSLMVDGRWLLRNGVITAFDEAKVTAAAYAYARELRESALERTNDVASLHSTYAKWQENVFSEHRCPSCDALSGPRRQGYNCDPA